jgi:uncharacterized RDD family membrane protein YckC
VDPSLNESEDLAWPGRAPGQASAYTDDWPASTGKARMAGFFIRGLAFFLDLAILSVLFLILLRAGNFGMSTALKGLYLESSSAELIRLLLGIYPAVAFSLFFTYFTFFVAYGGQTPGKMLFRIRVLTKDQQPLTGWKAFLRTSGYFISSFLLLGLGFLVIIIHPQKRAVHDFIAGSAVLKDTSHL